MSLNNFIYKSSGYKKISFPLMTILSYIKNMSYSIQNSAKQIKNISPTCDYIVYI